MSQLAPPTASTRFVPPPPLSRPADRRADIGAESSAGTAASRLAHASVSTALTATLRFSMMTAAAFAGVVPICALISLVTTRRWVERFTFGTGGPSLVEVDARVADLVRAMLVSFACVAVVAVLLIVWSFQAYRATDRLRFSGRASGAASGPAPGFIRGLRLQIPTLWASCFAVGSFAMVLGLGLLVVPGEAPTRWEAGHHVAALGGVVLAFGMLHGARLVRHAGNELSAARLASSARHLVSTARAA